MVGSYLDHGPSHVQVDVKKPTSSHTSTFYWSVVLHDNFKHCTFEIDLIVCLLLFWLAIRETRVQCYLQSIRTVLVISTSFCEQFLFFSYCQLSLPWSTSWFAPVISSSQSKDLDHETAERNREIEFLLASLLSACYPATHWYTAKQ